MKRIENILLAIPIFLGGCTSLKDVLNPAYVPQPLIVYDQPKYAADVDFCLKGGDKYISGVFLGSIVTATVGGATDNLSTAPINPTGPAFGALGGAIGSLSRGLNVVSNNRLAVARNCLITLTNWDRSALVADPRN